MMAKVLVWQSQLAANDFPPVCAMTGQQAEMWRKFAFSTSPAWSFWVGGILAAAITARRASGYLPLTRASARRLRRLTWGVAGLFPLGAVFFLLALVVQSDTLTFALVVLAFAAVVVGTVGLSVVRRAYGPTGKVLEPQPGHFQSLVELSNVHPAFVTAVQQLQQMRAQQTYAAQFPHSEKSK
jgi:hypothetical protein